METGLVLGKFYPPHLGHLYLLEFALKKVNELLVVVGSLPSETIPGEKRRRWLEQCLGPRAEVVVIPDDNPPGITSDQEEYFTIWRDNLVNHMPYIPDVIFASEPYVEKLATLMNMKFVLVDPNRTTIPISATMIRSNPKKYYEYLPSVVQEYYDSLENEQNPDINSSSKTSHTQ